MKTLCNETQTTVILKGGKPRLEPKGLPGDCVSVPDEFLERPDVKRLLQATPPVLSAKGETAPRALPPVEVPRATAPKEVAPTAVHSSAKMDATVEKVSARVPSPLSAVDPVAAPAPKPAPVPIAVKDAPRPAAEPTTVEHETRRKKR